MTFSLCLQLSEIEWIKSFSRGLGTEGKQSKLRLHQPQHQAGPESKGACILGPESPRDLPRGLAQTG